jgi:hypothetical protein
MKNWIVAVAMAAALAACSSGPSKGDIQSALEKHVQDNGWDDAAVEDLKAGECKESTATAGFVCTVEFRTVANQGRFNEQMGGSFVFDQVEGDWRVAGVAGL